ncbi:protein spire homolog 1-like isoform X2 [Tubulanus polymorphus]|uniref:protein spire homolog 1-like isoform X2 n=1 Tax=Tubulanus polymorphus TaxID=672921 RepID=UPI003DA6122D
MTDSSKHSESTDGIDDEGIENDSINQNSFTLNDVLKVCRRHLPDDSDSHYRAVCRALVSEAEELVTFLEKISFNEEKVRDEEKQLEDLERVDWARIWIQVLKQMRTGIQLKKTQNHYSQSIEYELTPYEMLMEDIRYRRYRLNKVQIETSKLPAKVKEDAHAVILEFIRSRPPLHPAKDRVLKSPPKRDFDPREELMEAIRGSAGEHRQLKPTAYGDLQRRNTISGVETSRTKLFEDGLTPTPTRKLIKADFNLLSSYSDDDEMSEDEDEEIKNRVHVSPANVVQLSPITPDTNQQHLQSWQKRVTLDLATEERKLNSGPERRHSITVCQSPVSAAAASYPYKVLSPLLLFGETKRDETDDFIDPHGVPWTAKHSPPNILNISSSPNSKFKDPLQCLSLTVEEVMHIRNVLTKAELESLIVDAELYKLVEKSKICFNCKLTRFTLFGEWGTKCKFCKRTICNRCCRKMHIPTEHFENIPVYTLSPSPMSPNTEQQLLNDMTGSCPSSPVIALKTVQNKTPPKTSTPTGGGGAGGGGAEHRRTRFQRAQTTVSTKPQQINPNLKGPQMTICKECKSMIVSIVRASRTSVHKQRRKRPTIDDSSAAPAKPSRNFHLNLKPVYK